MMSASFAELSARERLAALVDAGSARPPSNVK